MNKKEEQKPKEIELQNVNLVNGINAHKKNKIICKFWMMSNCIKDEKCEYLHTERDKIGRQNYPITECSMYKLGFCKNGPICTYKHNKENKSEEELENLPELPIWYLELIMGKPINLLYEDYEIENQEEIRQLKQKYNFNKPKKNLINRNSLYPNPLYKYDVYAEKKESILEFLNLKVRYFYIRNKSMDLVQFVMETNILLVNKQNSIKFKEAKKSCDEIIFVIFDEENNNFNGFCKFRKELDDPEVKVIAEHYFNPRNKNIMDDFISENLNQSAFVKVEWYWKTKLSANKVEFIKNPLNENEVFIDSKDGQEVSVDLGNYICRMMIKRLSKEEVKHYMDYKKLYEENEGKIESFHLIENSFYKFTNNRQNHYNYFYDIKGNNFRENNSNNFRDNNLYNNPIENLNLNSLIYEEINKNTNTKQNNSGNIIVTNISNLQVNIAPTQYTYENKNVIKNVERKRSRSKKRKNRKRSRTRSRSIDRNRNIEKCSKYSSRKKNEIDSEENYDSDQTVVLCEEDSEMTRINSFSTKDAKDEVNLPNDKEISNNFLNKKTKSSEDLNIVKSSDSGIVNPQINKLKLEKLTEINKSDNKIIQNKLFSNAMEKIALNYRVTKKTN